MKQKMINALCVATIATLSAGFANITPKVIYGSDNRHEIYETPVAMIRDVADSTVALVVKNNMTFYTDGSAVLKRMDFGINKNLCSDERFYDQPVAASCSGSLVGTDLIATAGHCISSSTCANYKIIFGFNMRNSTTAQMSIAPDDLYSCKEVVSRRYDSVDYALVRLDRPVRGHKPLRLQQTPVQSGDPVYVVGHPSGLPMKYAGGANVRTQRGAFFTTNLDTYAGNSGSPVFNALTHEVVGILVRGAADFVKDNNRQCNISNVCAQNGCRGEDVTNISYINDILQN